VDGDRASDNHADIDRDIYSDAKCDTYGDRRPDPYAGGRVPHGVQHQRAGRAELGVSMVAPGDDTAFFAADYGQHRGGL
jgi:hypothetical protein